MQIIGWDVATRREKMGFSRARFQGEVWEILEVRQGTGSRSTTDLLASWLETDPQSLLAVDAPLGWPLSMGRQLASHWAGQGLVGEAHPFFRRETDRFVKEKVGKLPLDVGADRIARTAFGALTVLEELRMRTGMPLDLGWTPGHLQEAGVIEVYPGGTLKAYGQVHSGYKQAGDREKRQELVDFLRSFFQISDDQAATMVDHADALDSGVCLLSGLDYLKGQVYMPQDQELAKKEGWIWAKRKEKEGSIRG